MTDDFAEGWMEFEQFIDKLMAERKRTLKDIDQYVEMYKADKQ